MELFKKTYSDQFTLVLAPLAAGIVTRQILNNYRRCYLKRVTWSGIIYNPTIQQVINRSLNTVIQDEINITLNAPGVPVLQSLARDFIATTPPAINTVNGIYLYETGQFEFNDLFFQNDLFIRYAATSFDAASDINLTVSVMVEIEEAG